MQDRIWPLEINTHIAQSHCKLFEMIDGASHQHVTTNLGLGRRPDMPKGNGSNEVAAEQYVYSYAAALVWMGAHRTSELL